MQRTEQDWGNLRDMGVEQGHRIEGQAEPGRRAPAPVRVHPGTDAEPGSPARRARAHARARRHSRLVRFLKWAIPFGAVAGAGIVAALAVIEPFSQFEGLTIGPLSISGTRVTMESPKLTGYRSQSGPYEVTASAAMQDVRRPGLIELQDLKARLAIERGGATARLEATSGLLDTKKELFELSRGVRVQSDRGQAVTLQSASVDFRAGTVVSHETVTVTFENGSIEAAGVEVSDNGRVLHFKGRVRTTFSGPIAEEPAPARIGEADAPAGPARTAAAETPLAPARIAPAESPVAPVRAAPSGAPLVPARLVPSETPLAPARTSQAEAGSSRR